MGYRPDDWLIEELTQQGDDGHPFMPKDSASTLLNWARSARARRPIVLVGAGMSLNAGPVPRWQELDPTRSRSKPPRALVWSALAAELRKELEHDGEGEEADALWLAELYKQRFGPESLLRKIEQAVPDQLLDPGEAHHALFEVPWQTILTTNYDTLIEKAHKKFKIASRLRVSESDLDLVRSSNREEDLELIYLHGVLSRPERIVLSLDDYRRYPVTHPGLLAKARQLFLQHPVLLIGFSATDPNFVQWSGWVNDLVGTFRNPWINLSVGKQPGVARRAYWKGALEFIAIEARKLAKVLQILGKFFRPMDDASEFEFSASRIDRVQSIPELVKYLPSCLEPLGGTLPTDNELDYRRDLLGRAAKRAFSITFSPKGDEAWAESQQIFANAKSQLRTAFGRDWPLFILTIANYHGKDWSYKQFTLNLLSELNSLPTDTPTAIKDELRLRLLVFHLEKSMSTDVETVVRDFLEHEPVVDEQVKIAGLIQLQKLRLGEQLNLPERAGDAQSLRQSGFIHALKSEFTEALDCYTRAAFLSREEGEPELIEWLTIESANGLLIAVSSIEREQSHLDSDELARRRAWLQKNIADRISWFRALEVNALDEISRNAREQMWNLPSRKVDSKKTNSAARRLQHWLESFWLSPWTIGRVAELNGQLQWNNRETLKAARDLSCYGSPLLGEWIEREVAAPVRSQFMPQLISFLLQPGRWPGEWMVRAESLQHVVPELTDAQLTQLGQWLTDARAQVNDQQKALRGDEFTSTNSGLKHFLLTQFGRWRFSGASIFLLEYSSWLALVRDSFFSLQLFSDELRSLPWEYWFGTNQVTPEAVDNCLDDVFSAWQASETRDAFTLQNAMGAVLDLLTDVGMHALPKSGKALEFVRTALESELLPERFVSIPSALSVILSTSDEMTAVAVEAARLCGRVTASKEGGASAEVLVSLAIVANGISATQREELLAKLESSSSSVINKLLPDIEWYNSIARLTAMLLPELASDEAERWRRLLTLCLERSPRAVRYAALLSEPVAGTAWPLIREHFYALLVGGQQVYSSDDQFNALQALSFLLHGTSAAFPDEWRIGVGVLTHSVDFAVATSACQILSAIVDTGRLTAATSPTILSQWALALIEAAKDGRAEVAGAAGYALVLGTTAGCVNQEDLGRVEQVLSELRSDKRVGVRRYLEWAAWKSRKLKA